MAIPIREYPLPHFEDRERGMSPTMLVIHYTQCSTEEALKLLTGSVSAHYVVPPEGRFIYKLVDEKKAARHAGISHWRDKDNLNTHSIGIEVVNWGYTYGWMPPEPSNQMLKSVWQRCMHWNQHVGDFLTQKKIPWFPKRWLPFPPQQINAIVQIAQQILTNWPIDPDKVVGHADIAPQRKTDPGPLFPWNQLAARGIGAWPDVSKPRVDSDKPREVNVAWMQKSLQEWGYQVPRTGVLDPETRNVVRAFQMHFRPEKCDGLIDLETMDRLDALLCERRIREQVDPPLVIP
jgi:N-acetylmuramoyl-L-alanine amidase